jgi:hypothetical protein
LMLTCAILAENGFTGTVQSVKQSAKLAILRLRGLEIADTDTVPTVVTGRK